MEKINHEPSRPVAVAAQRSPSGVRALWPVLVLIVVATVLRVAGVIASPVELHGDEAQYWSWSGSFEWGYYSKPPLIAWTIGATTALFGDSEWAVRLASPFTHGLAALFLALLARDMARSASLSAAGAGLAAAILYLAMPAVFLSSAIASTDALLLPSYAAALFAFNRLRERGDWASAAGLGVALGIGFLAKYAMVYSLVGLALVAVIEPEARLRLVSAKGAAAGAIGLAILAPNLIWNAQNDFATVSHTAANANWGGSLFNPGMLAKFIGDQFGVFGPLTLALTPLAAWSLLRRPRSEPGAPSLASSTRLLIAFAAPILLVVATQAFISRANANWGVAAFAPLTVLVALWAVSGAGRATRALAALAVGLNLVIGGIFVVGGLSPSAANAMGLANSFKRARGWAETTAQVRAVFDAGHAGRPYDRVALDNRLVFHGLEYYGRADPLPLAMWRRQAGALSHAEERAPLTAAEHGEDLVLFVSERAYEAYRIAADFAAIERVGVLNIELGGGKVRRLDLYAAEGFAPLTRDAAYEERLIDAPAS